MHTRTTPRRLTQSAHLGTALTLALTLLATTASAAPHCPLGMKIGQSLWHASHFYRTEVLDTKYGDGLSLYVYTKNVGPGPSTCSTSIGACGWTGRLRQGRMHSTRCLLYEQRETGRYTVWQVGQGPHCFYRFELCQLPKGAVLPVSTRDGAEEAGEGNELADDSNNPAGPGGIDFSGALDQEDRSNADEDDVAGEEQSESADDGVGNPGGEH
jgi:hypothetical protein